MEYEGQRERMVREQIESRGIRDPRVLAAFREVPRHRFVEEALAGSAYGDHALPIGEGQTISQPYMVALMTELLQPAPAHRVLEIGTGSGYQTMILTRLVRTVYTIERVTALALRAQSLLGQLGVENAVFRIGDGTLGWRRFAPFDGILVAAGAPVAPPTLLDQLREGARLVIPTGSRSQQQLEVYRRGVGEEIAPIRSVPCAFVPLIGREGWSE
jgi:protein-L-isoaspartate(D-aspartate) O-methyltransferase